MHSFFNVPISAVTPLEPEGAVRFLTTLLNAECTAVSLSPSALTISSRITVADGGIDAEVKTGNYTITGTAIFQSGRTGFQIKSGISFKPWTKSSMRDELFNKNGRLYPEVEDLVNNNGHYTVLCTGHDLTPQQRNKARALIRSYFPSTYTGMIEVLGASQIATYSSRYPGTATMLTGRSLLEALSIEEWQMQEHMSNPFENAVEQSQLINQIRYCLTGATKHIRILGEPGLGKTRLVLEAVRIPAIAPLVLYFEHGPLFAQTQLFRELLKLPSTTPLVLVLDEVPEYELKDIWNNLKNRCGNLKIISLDNGIDKSTDSEIYTLQSPRLKNESIISLMRGKLGEIRGLERWAEICKGSPRVALAVADNLRENPDDILKEPSTVPLWDRFVHGYTINNSSSSTKQQNNCVVTHLSLFSRFGYEPPVDNEAQYIHQQIQKMDPSIGWGLFQDIVATLRKRRVLQGNKTLFFVPKALHIYLWRQYWKNYGRGFNFTETIQVIPELLRVWFMAMFKYAAGHATEPLLDEILKTDGFFSSPGMIRSKHGAEFLSILAESAPEKVLILLEATLAQWRDEELLGFLVGRQHIVWTLEKIAVWPQLTVRAISVLARLAINENGSNRNNATGTLLGLFAIGPEYAATEASPKKRLKALKNLLSSSEIRMKQLGLRAAVSALNTRGGGIRIVGPEYQGIKERAKLWIPQTYGEYWDAKQMYLESLHSAHSIWPQEQESELCSALLEGVKELICIPYCAPKALEILRELVDNESTNQHELNSFFRDFFSWRNKKCDKAVAKELKKLEKKNTGTNITTRFQRYVVDCDWSEWDEEYRKKTLHRTIFVKKFKSLQ